MYYDRLVSSRGDRPPTGACSATDQEPIARPFGCEIVSTDLKTTSIFGRPCKLCVTAVKEWYSSRRLQLNADKTEVIWFGTRANLMRLSQLDRSLQLESTIIKPVETVQNLGVYMDNELNMRLHIGNVASMCFYHLRRLRQLRYVLTPSYISLRAYTIAVRLLLADLLAVTLAPLQRVVYAVNRLLANFDFRVPLTASMKALHWLSITYCIKYKLCLMMHAAGVQTTSLSHLYRLHLYLIVLDCDRPRLVLLMFHQYGHNLAGDRITNSKMVDKMAAVKHYNWL